MFASWFPTAKAPIGGNVENGHVTAFVTQELSRGCSGSKRVTRFCAGRSQSYHAIVKPFLFFVSHLEGRGCGFVGRSCVVYLSFDEATESRARFSSLFTFLYPPPLHSCCHYYRCARAHVPLCPQAIITHSKSDELCRDFASELVANESCERRGLREAGHEAPIRSWPRGSTRTQTGSVRRGGSCFAGAAAGGEGAERGSRDDPPRLFVSS